MNANRFDAVVIGAGHNGLVAAAYLARAGRTVCVLERRDLVGGACVTENLENEAGKVWKQARTHTGAYLCSLLHPTIIYDLDLSRYGFQIIQRQTSGISLFPNHEYLFTYPDQQRQIAELNRFCPGDTKAYMDFEEILAKAGDCIDPFLLKPPVPIDDVIASAVDTQTSRFLQLLFRASIREILDSRFHSEGLKAVLSTDGVIGTSAGPSTPGTGYVFFHHTIGRALGTRGLWGYVKGGMGALTNAIAESVRAVGGTIRTESPVRSIILENGQAGGVVLEDGTEVRSRIVLSGADARCTFLRLVGEQHLPQDFVTGVRSIPMNGVSAKINLLLEELPRFTCLSTGDPCEDRCPYFGTIHISPTMDYIDEAFAQAATGQPSTSPMVECTLQTFTDPSLAPDGIHVLSLFTQYYPYRLNATLDPDNEKERFADRVVELLNEFAPNVQDSILARHVLTPADLEARFGLTGGHIFHGELLPEWIFMNRPVRGWCRYRTPINGLYLCGSSAHPGGCVSGLPGRNAALAVIGDW